MAPVLPFAPPADPPGLLVSLCVAVFAIGLLIQPSRRTLMLILLMISITGALLWNTPTQLRFFYALALLTAVAAFPRALHEWAYAHPAHRLAPAMAHVAHILEHSALTQSVADHVAWHRARSADLRDVAESIALRHASSRLDVGMWLHYGHLRWLDRWHEMLAWSRQPSADRDPVVNGIRVYARVTALSGLGRAEEALEEIEAMHGQSALDAWWQRAAMTSLLAECGRLDALRALSLAGANRLLLVHETICHQVNGRSDLAQPLLQKMGRIAFLRESARYLRDEPRKALQFSEAVAGRLDALARLLTRAAWRVRPTNTPLFGIFTASVSVCSLLGVWQLIRPLGAGPLITAINPAAGFDQPLLRWLSAPFVTGAPNAQLLLLLAGLFVAQRRGGATEHAIQFLMFLGSLSVAPLAMLVFTWLNPLPMLAELARWSVAGSLTTIGGPAATAVFAALFLLLVEKMRAQSVFRLAAFVTICMVVTLLPIYGVGGLATAIAISALVPVLVCVYALWRG